ncbi:MAG TPA: hypothetical protein VK147_11345 [Candidatus Didemnitutus sp.]|nr:hypothetical protein [Candidatus Didemnitutus sp.]
MKRILLVLAFGLVIALPARAVDTVRICTYNILKFSEDNVDGRMPQFKRVLDSIRPHIMLSQEVADNTAGPRFVSEVFTWAPFAAIPFVDGPDTDHMVFYDQTLFDLVSTRVIPTELRNIQEVILALRPHDQTLADTIVLYSVHLKASDGSSEAAQRLREINTLIGTLSSRPHVMICGDFNIYGPTESAYTALVGPTATRRFVDPLGGAWRRNDASFAKIYTQCTRKSNLGACGGGVDGGVDDRFDLLLASQELSSRVLTQTYTAFGNDGLPRLNESIDDPKNILVSSEMAAALKCASDHLPAYVDVILGDVQASVDDVQQQALVATWEAPYLKISGMQIGEQYRVYTTAGGLVATITAHTVEQRIMLSSLASGVYSLAGPRTQIRFAVSR